MLRTVGSGDMGYGIWDTCCPSLYLDCFPSPSPQPARHQQPPEHRRWRAESRVSRWGAPRRTPQAQIAVQRALRQRPDQGRRRR
jgi:hypothetical protein